MSQDSAKSETNTACGAMADKAEDISDAERAKLAWDHVSEISQQLEDERQARSAAHIEVLSLRSKVARQEKEILQLKRQIENPERLPIVQKLRSESKALEASEVKREAYVTGILHENISSKVKIKLAEKRETLWEHIVGDMVKKGSVKVGTEPALGKRKVNTDMSSASQPLSKKAKTDRYIPCTKCHVNGRKCDSNTNACSECILRGEGRNCKRVKCKHFDTGKCQNKKCKFAHESDNCYRLIEYTKLKPNKGGQSSRQDCERAEDGGSEISDAWDKTDEKDDVDDGMDDVEL